VREAYGEIVVSLGQEEKHERVEMSWRKGDLLLL
jgi:hypothetical protein